MVEATTTDLAFAKENVIKVAMQVKEARRFAKKDGVDKVFVCASGAYDAATGEGGCHGCRPYERILAHDESMEFVGIGGFNQDMYIEKKDDQ